MTGDTYLLLDCNYLCYRAFYSLGMGGHGKRLTNGIQYGFLKNLPALQDYHNTDKFVFCFDHRNNKRVEKYPFYRANRLVVSSSFINDKFSAESKKDLRRQITELRESILPDIGYTNIFCEEGYEADDLIAAIARSLPRRKDHAIIVTADKDMYQCLTPNVSIWKPDKKKFYTADMLLEEFGVLPTTWPSVKAIAGCSSDNIPGVKGVGEITAARYICGKLSPHTKSYKDIQASKEMFTRNYELVRLPYEGVTTPILRPDKFKQSKLDEIATRLGMPSLRGR